MFRGRMGLSVHHVTFLTVTQSWFNRPYIVGVHRWPLLTLLIPRMWFWRWVHSGWHMCDLAWVKHLNEPMGTAEQMSGCRLIFNCDFLRSFDPLCRSFGTFCQWGLWPCTMVRKCLVVAHYKWLATYSLAPPASFCSISLCSTSLHNTKLIVSCR